jgi:hypothetical protein
MNKRTLQSLVMEVSIGIVVGLGVYTIVYANGGHTILQT